MTNKWYILSFLWISCFFSSLAATCIPSADIQAGWRRDNIYWKAYSLDSSYTDTDGRSRLHFKDMESYTIGGKIRWIDTDYYIRLSADYGISYKGRGKESFSLYSSLFDSDYVSVHTNNAMKRNNDVYDLNGAVGYPFAFCCNRLAIIPMIGFSYHHQYIRLKQQHHDYSYSSDSSDSSTFIPDFFSSSSNPFDTFVSSDPFKSSSSSTIASALGLINYQQTQKYRFTWYGFYLGLDFAYALDSFWTLFGEFEGHFYNRCHAKRKSLTGVSYIDHYHRVGWSYGFDGALGTTFSLANDWYGILTVDYKWHHSHTHHHQDVIHWQSVGVKGGLGYMF